MAKSALGYHWKQITPAQQQEFTTAFVAFIEDSYLSKINDYKGQQVTFLRATNDGPQYAQVNTDIVQPTGDPIHVNYRLLQNGSAWKIYDVTVDAISIIANYRNQFNRVMNNQGYDILISDLKKQAGSPCSQPRQPLTEYGFLRGRTGTLLRKKSKAAAPWRSK